MPDRLKHKVAIVTGGGTGIGQAIAVFFAREGARVVVAGRTTATLEKTVRQITNEGGDAFYIRTDVSMASEVEDMVEGTVGKYGKLNILVNNAGVSCYMKTILDVTEEEWDRTFNIDAKGSWLCSRCAIPEMRKAGGGAIIMVSSISAYCGQTMNAIYNAAKAAQEQLMKCMALDFARDNIRVNSICPAWVMTEMNRDLINDMGANPGKVFPDGNTYADVIKMHPLGRLGTPEDCAWAAVYLASDESRWVTGASFMIDGGYTCR